MGLKSLTSCSVEFQQQHQWKCLVQIKLSNWNAVLALTRKHANRTNILRIYVRMHEKTEKKLVCTRNSKPGNMTRWPKTCGAAIDVILNKLLNDICFFWVQKQEQNPVPTSCNRGHENHPPWLQILYCLLKVNKSQDHPSFGGVF